MPSGYHFGITAASAETADSFEANKFLLFTAQSVTREEPRRAQPPPVEQPNTNNGNPADAPASNIVDHSAQFEDLHNRLQIMAHQLDNLVRDVKGLADKSDSRHQEISQKVMSADRLNAMDQKLQGIDNTVRDYQGQLSSLQSLLKDSHSSLVEGLPKHMSDSAITSLQNEFLLLTPSTVITTKAPRMGLLLFIFVGVQLLLAGSYVIYKRRRANGPKKYL